MKQKRKYSSKTIAKAICTVLLPCLLSLFVSCENQTEKEKTQKELLIYCGITMIRPMTKIAQIIEEQENCRIIITKGGSGNLLKSIKANKMGDLYLPGSDSYIKTCLKENLVSKTALVGHNMAAMMVQKGNPKSITNDLENLLNPEYYIVLGNPQSGSIGRETKKILAKRGFFDKAMANARILTTDSKDLIKALKEREADLVINWYATSAWPENAPYVDVLKINPEYAQPKKLVLGLLTTSKYPEISKKFIKYASSEKGRAVFAEFGLK
ncbi:substrate-binding domain-containing protein [Dethiosulfatarculus sandiegensis]|uniref:Molybdenum ABC transporter substrate-binding protein n=1 Tax=Dethiosulfatarculus sandiegensis TaxID=1429043 RepID=A0A0D2K1U9_9BACT|nr:substrate-binding domain-containing protein [Dethiosulfatarculus sandiegensis]KIX15660.1 molybdenum ABC transporter substrate-binding protein [Dethiosulfatarculus sandiegensis]